MLAAIVLLQTVAGPPAPRESRSVAAAPVPCPVEDGDGDVVVCARKSDSPRLAKPPDQEPRSPQAMATFRLPGHATGNVHAFQDDLPGGGGQGAAVTIKIPFGRGKKR